MLLNLDTFPRNSLPLLNMSFFRLIMRLTVEQRAEIAVLYPSKSMGQLALEYNISKTAVHKIIKKKAIFGTVVDRPRSGRPRISTVKDDRHLVRLAMRDLFQTAGNLRNQWNVESSVATVKLRLFGSGLRGCLSMRKPPLTQKHRRMRLEWCRARRNWTTEQWRDVVYVDEAAFCQLSTTRSFVCRRQHEG
jgi:transposase